MNVSPSYEDTRMPPVAFLNYGLIGLCGLIIWLFWRPFYREQRRTGTPRKQNYSILMDFHRSFGDAGWHWSHFGAVQNRKRPHKGRLIRSQDYSSSDGADNSEDQGCRPEGARCCEG